MEIFKDFGIQPILLLAQIINFAILLFLLKRFLYKPILKVLDERKKRIETSLKQAEEIQKKFVEANIEQEKILDTAKLQASRIIENAKEGAKILSEQLQEETNKEIESTLERAKSALQLEKQKMISEAKGKIVDIVVLVTEKVTAKTLQKAEKEKLVNNALSEIKE